MKKIVKRSSCLICPPLPTMVNSPFWARASSLSRLHDHTQTQRLAGLCWMSDEPNTETYAWEHKTLTRDRHPCPQRDLNLQYQQASGRRPTPWTVQPLGLVGGFLTRVNITIGCWGFFIYDASAMDYYFTFIVPVTYMSRSFPGDSGLFTSELSDSAYCYSICLHWKVVVN